MGGGSVGAFDDVRRILRAAERVLGLFVVPDDFWDVSCDGCKRLVDGQDPALGARSLPLLLPDTAKNATVEAGKPGS